MTIRICVGTTCKNAALTIGYSLSTLLKQERQGIDLSFVIVDSYSTDGTPSVVAEVLRDYPVKIVQAHCNIPEGRNLVVKHALDFDPDYIFFLDADVILKYKTLLKLAVTISRGDAVVALARELRQFSTEHELRKYCEEVLASLDRRVLWLEDVHVSKARWCTLDATLIPRKVAEKIEFDPDMTFADDAKFGFDLWRHGYKVYVVDSYDKPVADVNLARGKRYNLYLRLSIADYLRGLRKKVLYRYIWSVYDPDSLLITYLRFLEGDGRRMLPYVAMDLLLLLSLFLDPVLFALLVIAALLLAARWCLRKGVSIREAPIQLAKFNIYSVASVMLFPILYILHKRELDEAYRNFLSAPDTCFK
jgi:glycosyltransferase involved in cell wall biosynthesis